MSNAGFSVKWLTFYLILLYISNFIVIYIIPNGNWGLKIVFSAFFNSFCSVSFIFCINQVREERKN